MSKESMFKNKKVMNAIYLGVLCSVSYLAVYFARNVLGTVTPQMVESGYSEVYIGKASSIYFIFYAIGQLINGFIGDKIKAKYMISIGLFMAGVTNLVFSEISLAQPDIALIVYGFTGYFLSMIYGPMTRVVAENTEPIYATRCSLGYTFASFFGSPLAGVTATFMVWQSVFFASSLSLCVMAVICFSFFMLFEKKGIVNYSQFARGRERGAGIKVLIKRQIIKFTFISIVTGVVRTTVVFWMPTYISQYLGFAPEHAAAIFTAATLVISLTTFISVFIYEKLGRNMDLTIQIMFSSATVFFLLLYMVKQPALNVVFLVLGIMSSNGAASMLWSRYCPSLRDTGMVSSATGFLDFVSYIAAAVSSTVFANAASTIGWGNLILVWFGLMVFGVIISLPYKRKSAEN
ncbi:MAG: MFS transporter [Clostridia bacterium]|nr:MFS transporter [Clostridia bacterium]